MKKTMLIALLAVVLVHVGARPASAQAGIIRWIAKLSGPGGFVGPGYEFFPLCFGKKNGVTRLGPLNPAAITDDRVFAADLNCRGFQRDGRLLLGGFQVAHMTGGNNQQYDSSVAESFTDRVEAILVMEQPTWASATPPSTSASAQDLFVSTACQRSHSTTRSITCG